MSAPTPRRRGTTAAVSTAASPLSTASFSANCFRGAEVRALKGVNGQVWGAPLAPAARRQRWQRQAHQRRRRRRQPRQHLAWTTPQRRRRRRRQRRQQPSPHNMAARPSTRQTRCQRRRHRYSHRHRHRLCRRRRRGAAEAGPPSLALRKPANRWRQCGRGGRPCAVTVAAAARPRCHRRRRPRHGRQRHCCPRWPLGARPDAGTSHLREPGAAARRTPTTPPLQLPAYLIPPPPCPLLRPPIPVASLLPHAAAATVASDYGGRRRPRPPSRPTRPQRCSRHQRRRNLSPPLKCRTSLPQHESTANVADDDGGRVGWPCWWPTSPPAGPGGGASRQELAFVRPLCFLQSRGEGRGEDDGRGHA